jgi:flagellar biosynthesis anti-sigma factor FlgM
VTNIPNGGGRDGQHIQDLGGSARASRPVHPKDAQGARPAASATPSVQVSAHGERFVSLRARLEALEPARAERIERLRELVATGRYQPNSDDVAGAMLADPATAAALGIRGAGSSAPEAP